MKVLLSAFSCHPTAGSEPGAGWGFAKALSDHHDVWLLTREFERDAIEQELEKLPRPRLRVVYLDCPPPIRSAAAGGPSLIADYFVWQFIAVRVCRRLHREVGFDIAHHVTFAGDWMPCALASVPGLPFVWGPVGGYNDPVWGMARWLGAKGLATEVLRTLLTGALRYTVGRRVARAAALVVATNSEVARYFQRATDNVAIGSKVVVEPNMVVELEPYEPTIGASPGGGLHAGTDSDKAAVFIGRLLPWKGLSLALHALAQPAASGWRLDVIGDGPDRRRSEALAARLGVMHRVRFLGAVPHAQAVLALQQADAMLQPSMHEAGGFAVAEAVSCGCPVVCLDRGGPSIAVGVAAGEKVVPGPHLPERLAQALARVPARGEPSMLWSGARLGPLSDAWYKSALSGPDRKRPDDTDNRRVLAA